MISRRGLWVAAAVVTGLSAVAIGVRVLIGTGSLDTADQIASVVSGLLATAAFALTLRQSVVSRRQPATGDAPVPGIPARTGTEAAVFDLAERTRRVWAAEATNQELDEVDRIDVRWEVDAARSRKLTEIYRRDVPRHGLVSDLHDTLYAPLPARAHLVLLGEGGTGKSAAMLRVLLDALDARAADPDLPVPVWVTLGQWNPQERSLADVAVEAMEWMLPGLRNTDVYGPGAARRLIESKKVAFFLDGLDEMPSPDLRRAAMDAAGRAAATHRVVVTGRPDGYVAARGAGRRATPTVVAHLPPLDADTIASALTRGQTGAAEPFWEALAETIRTDAKCPVAVALDTPLMISLSLAAYPDPPEGADPRELLTLTSVGEIRDRVIDQFLDRSYPDDVPSLVERVQHRVATTGRPRGRRSRRHLVRRRRQSLRTLEWLASRMSAGSDLRWWQIPEWVSGDRLAGRVGLVLGTVIGAAFGVGTVVAHPENPWFAVGTAMLGFGFGLASGVLAYNRTRRMHLPPRVLSLRWPTRAEARRLVGQGTGVGLPFLVGIGLSGKWAAGAVVGLMFFVVAAVGGDFGPKDNGLLAVWSKPVAKTPAMTPLTSYRADLLRSNVVVVATVVAITGFLSAVSLFDPESSLSWSVRYGPGIAVSVAAYIALGPAVLLRLAPFARQNADLGFSSIGHTLRAAHDLQVLRQAGIVYQFRHRALQDHLASRYSGDDGTP